MLRGILKPLVAYSVAHPTPKITSPTQLDTLTWDSSPLSHPLPRPAGEAPRLTGSVWGQVLPREFKRQMGCFCYFEYFAGCSVARIRAGSDCYVLAAAIRAGSLLHVLARCSTCSLVSTCSLEFFFRACAATWANAKLERATIYVKPKQSLLNGETPRNERARSKSSPLLEYVLAQNLHSPLSPHRNKTHVLGAPQRRASTEVVMAALQWLQGRLEALLQLLGCTHSVSAGPTCSLNL